MNQYIFYCSKEEPELSKLEIERLLHCSCTEVAQGVFLASVSNEDNFSRLAMTRQVCVVLETIEDISLLSDNLFETNYKIDTIGEHAPEAKQLADSLYGSHSMFKELSVNIHDPKHLYVFFYADKIYVTEQIWQNKVSFEERKTHLLASPHPTGMHPRIASALINVCGVNSFLDPFCGSGGLVLEGLRMGLTVKGSDISEQMIERAKNNANHLNLNGDFTVNDALKITDSYEAIITDLPYGKSSTISEQDLYIKFLSHAKTITSLLLVGLPDSVDMTTLANQTGWHVKYTISIYIHKSMTRNFYLLM